LTGDLATATRLEASSPAYRRVLEASPNEADASIGLARVLVAQGRVEEAEGVLQQLQGRGFLEPEAERLKATLAFRNKTSLDVDACRSTRKRSTITCRARSPTPCRSCVTRSRQASSASRCRPLAARTSAHCSLRSKSSGFDSAALAASQLTRDVFVDWVTARVERHGST
jgi:hypothetical protein